MLPEPTTGASQTGTRFWNPSGTLPFIHDGPERSQVRCGPGGDPNARALTRPGPTSTLERDCRRDKMAVLDIAGKSARDQSIFLIAYPVGFANSYAVR